MPYIPDNLWRLTPTGYDSFAHESVRFLLNSSPSSTGQFRIRDLSRGGGVTSLLFPHNFVSTRFRIYLISWMHRFTVSLVVTPTLIILIFRPCQWLSQHNFCFKSPLSFSDYLELKSVTSCLVLIFAFLDFLHILRSDIVKS